MRREAHAVKGQRAAGAHTHTPHPRVHRSARRSLHTGRPRRKPTGLSFPGPSSHLAPARQPQGHARGNGGGGGRGTRATFPGGPRPPRTPPRTAEYGVRPRSSQRDPPGPAHRASPPLPPGRAASDGRSLLDRERGQTPSHFSVAPHWLPRLRRWCEREAIGPWPRQLRRREPRLPPATPFGLEGRGPEKTRAWG